MSVNIFFASPSVGPPGQWLKPTSLAVGPCWCNAWAKLRLGTGGLKRLTNSQVCQYICRSWYAMYIVYVNYCLSFCLWVYDGLCKCIVFSPCRLYDSIPLYEPPIMDAFVLQLAICGSSDTVFRGSKPRESLGVASPGGAWQWWGAGNWGPGTLDPASWNQKNHGKTMRSQACCWASWSPYCPGSQLECRLCVQLRIWNSESRPGSVTGILASKLGSQRFFAGHGLWCCTYVSWFCFRPEIWDNDPIFVSGSVNQRLMTSHSEW